MAVFEKSARLRHIGHLDIQRAVQRALRRSGLPIAYSKGFNPHVLVTFASALSTGSAGLNEIMDVTMEEEVSGEEFLEKMNRAMPRDMQLKSAVCIDQKHPALMAMLNAAEYDIEILEGDKAEAMIAAVPGYLAQETIITPRKTKSGIKDVDAKPLMYSVKGENGHLYATLALTERESCKPDMLINSLCAFAGCEAPRVMITRTRLLALNDAGERVPLETL